MHVVAVTGEVLGFLSAQHLAGLSSRRGRMRFTSGAHKGPIPPAGAEEVYTVANGTHSAFVGVDASLTVAEKKEALVTAMAALRQ